MRPAKPLLDDLGITIDVNAIKDGLQNGAVVAAKFVATHALTIGQNALLFGVQVVIMLYLLFFFLRDADKLLEQLVYVLPLGDTRARSLLKRFAAVANATIKGTFIVSALQGALTGLALWVIGIPNPVLWGVVAALFCLVPVFGSVLV